MPLEQIATLGKDAGIAVVSSLPEATWLAAALIRPLSPATQQQSTVITGKRRRD